MDSVPDYAPHLDWAKTASVAQTANALLAWGATTAGDVEVYVLDDERITYAELERRSAVFGRALLTAGLGKGARIGLLLPNGADFLASWFGAARIGVVVTPISTLSSSAELARILRSSGVSLLVATEAALNVDLRARIAAALELREAGGPQIATAVAPSLRGAWLWRGEAPWATPVANALQLGVPEAVFKAAEALVAPADAVAIVYTSGSTSEPKGVMHSHAAFVRSSRRWCASMPFKRGDRFFCNNPLFWVGGMITSVLAVMQVGATLVSSQSRDTDRVLDVIEQERCTLLQVWPYLNTILTQHESFPRRDFSSMRAGSAPAMLPAGSRTATSAPFGFAMGMTETAGPHSLGMATLDEAHRGAMGLLAPGMEHRIVDPETGARLPDGAFGELHVRGDTLMLGYVGRERHEVLDPDGWFATGDLCTIRDHHLFFHARLGAMIKTAGASVAPAEVEAALMQADGVAEAHVVGVPDPERGEVVGALVAFQPGEAPDVDRLLAKARELLSPYKVPRRLLVVDAFPLTSTNKLDRRAAVALLAQAVSGASRKC